MDDLLLRTILAGASRRANGGGGGGGIDPGIAEDWTVSAVPPNFLVLPRIELAAADDGDPVTSALDYSGNGYHLTPEGVLTPKPTVIVSDDKRGVLWDNTKDSLTTAVAASYWTDVSLLVGVAYSRVGGSGTGAIWFGGNATAGNGVGGGFGNTELGNTGSGLIGLLAGVIWVNNFVNANAQGTAIVSLVRLNDSQWRLRMYHNGVKTAGPGDYNKIAATGTTTLGGVASNDFRLHSGGLWAMASYRGVEDPDTFAPLLHDLLAAELPEA